jgi:hypothetical protein
MSDSLNHYIGRAESSAPLRLCRFLYSRAETIKDLCNSSLQAFAKRSHRSALEEKGGKGCRGEMEQEFPATSNFTKRTQYPIRILHVHSWFNRRNYEPMRSELRFKVPGSALSASPRENKITKRSH